MVLLYLLVVHTFFHTAHESPRVPLLSLEGLNGSLSGWRGFADHPWGAPNIQLHRKRWSCFRYVHRYVQIDDDWFLASLLPWFLPSLIYWSIISQFGVNKTCDGQLCQRFWFKRGFRPGDPGHGERKKGTAPTWGLDLCPDLCSASLWPRATGCNDWQEPWKWCSGFTMFPMTEPTIFVG